MKEERILAIDFGEKRIGIAVTDPMNIFAYPLITLQNDNNFLTNLKNIINEYNVVKVLIGNPIRESGGEPRILGLIIEMKEKIENKFGLPVELIDERYSSEIARQRILETVVSKKKRRDKSLLDKNSAAVILEDYLKSIEKQI
ncbi:MAG: Holliday junction resolvase RuvX [Melioribacteraceae bacterium]|nr:Holliday junction resolvase RuvX [Melioribacteraceae bacterium]